MRSFLAFEIPREIVGYLAGISNHLARRHGGVKWVHGEGIHITVKFLGDLDEAIPEKMKGVLSPLGLSHCPVNARLGQLDAFPSQWSARVIVVKLKKGIDGMQAIFADVEKGLERMGIERETRGFVPHITLGRRRIPKPFPNGDPFPVEERDFVVENLVLFKSTLTPGGAIYEPIWKIRLGGESE